MIDENENGVLTVLEYGSDSENWIESEFLEITFIPCVWNVSLYDQSLLRW